MNGYGSQCSIQATMFSVIHSARTTDWVMMKPQEPIVAATVSATRWPAAAEQSAMIAPGQIFPIRRCNAKAGAVTLFFVTQKGPKIRRGSFREDGLSEAI